ncbi:hypothetical protein L3Q82_022197 [Scortum barcoo]|uniref:Uncharacterized protein n=1 Tax=Scortum barcoo TaxID=214431 RepID=A0ACB8X1L6_9TELE|nr:hypothetical protein L3Q82_022197 [Scortum barcoo]
MDRTIPTNVSRPGHYTTEEKKILIVDICTSENNIISFNLTFPAGAGHWLVAYRKAEDQKYRSLYKRIKDIKSVADTPCGNTLDGLFLLQLHCVDKPSELCSLDISEQELNSVKPEDLKVFDNVAYIDASVNSLSLGSFSSFVFLRELNLSLNGIYDMTFNAADFPHLEILDLSYNSLAADVIVSIGWLPRLKVLHLTGNQLLHLPPNLGASSHDSTQLLIFHKENWEESCRGSSFPLPQLQVLNLADNKIAEEEALMAAALFPMLREIDIHANPLTTQRSGDPPLLTYYLQERLGVTIKRKKTQEAAKFQLKVSTDPKWKVEERIPKVLKRPLLMDALAQTHVEKSELTVKRTPQSEGRSRDTPHESTEHFFVTQVADVPECEFDLRPSDEKETAENKERDQDDAIPERFAYYELLMDAKPGADAVEPIGIQTAVRMLEHTLKTLNVYRDSKPKLDSIQTPYREREKRIKNLPPLKPTKQPTERVDEMIKAIKQSTAIREFPLSSAMQSTGANKQEHKEALSLLRDMKTKYKMVHKKTMEQEAAIGSDRNADQNGAEPPPVQML